VNPSDIFSKFQGESERYVKQLFQYAHRLPRAVIFFDEFDSIALTRCSGDSSQSRKLLSELLLQLTLSNKRHHLGSQDYKSCETRPDAGRERGIGLEQEQVQEQGHGRGQVVVIAATNRIEDLDEAVVRRFECKVYVGLPSNQERCLLVSSFLKGVSSQLSKKDLIEIAIMTNGWSGSDIESLCREAAMGPLRLFLSTAVSQLCPVIAGERKEDISNSKRFKSNPLVSTSSPILPVTFRDFAEAHAKLLINSGDLNGGEDCCDLVSRCTDER
jgi:SpoVK/Ycf46/Vps4 family AAA+-type ATPase